MTYKHTNRSGVAFVFLGIVTLGVYPVVVLSQVRKEVSCLLDGKGVGKQMPFVWAYLLGLITLGLAPLIWVCRMANKIEMAALEKKITSPRLSGAFMLWAYFGVLILIGPFLAYHRFFCLLNAIERRANEEEEEKAEGKISPAKQDMLKEVQKASQGEFPEPASQTPTLAQTPYPQLDQRTFDERASENEKPWASATKGNSKGRKWRVRSNGQIKVFDTKEEAIAYAKSILAEKRALSSKKEKRD